MEENCSVGSVEITPRLSQVMVR